MFLFHHPGTASTWFDLETEAQDVLMKAHNAFKSAEAALQKIKHPGNLSEEDQKNIQSATSFMKDEERFMKEAEGLLQKCKSSLADELKSIRKDVKEQGDEAALAMLAGLEAFVKQLEEHIKVLQSRDRQSIKYLQEQINAFKASR